VTKDNEFPLCIARADSDIKVVSIKSPRFDVVWVHPNNYICCCRASGTGGSAGTLQLLAAGKAMPCKGSGRVAEDKKRLKADIIT
jgi:hypothetical protein